jgi:RNA polymerase sigma-70 factor (ECF subfamily)
MKPSADEITLLLRDWQKGDDGAAAKLMPLVYSELRRVAARHMRQEQPGNTLQPTALVHEAYIKLLGQKNVRWEGRTHFFGVASHAMREILVEHARKRKAEKRGGSQKKVYVSDVVEPASPKRGVDLLALDEALNRLEKLDARQVKIVELRYFAGLSVEETSEVLEVSPRTVKRDWSSARVWLHREIRAQ